MMRVFREILKKVGHFSEFTANVLHACGARVSMTANPEEVLGFVDGADTLHLNLGTLDAERLAAINLSANYAREKGVAMVLDPVMVHLSQGRRKLAIELSDMATVIKGNSAEISALGMSGETQACIVETGKIDKVCYVKQVVSSANGDQLLDKVTATGCALGALVAALLPHARTPLIASVSGLLWFSVAAELAAEKAAGPGTFQPYFLDALYSVSPDQITQRAKLA